DQAVTHVTRERVQDGGGLVMAARADRQPLEADHRVAAPVGEPVIARDDRAAAIACAPRVRDVLLASDRNDQEGVGRENQFPGERRPWGSRTFDERLTALPFGAVGLVDIELRDGRPSSGPEHEIGAPIIAHRGLERAWRPQYSGMSVAALALYRVLQRGLQRR